MGLKVLVLHPEMDTLGGGERLCLSACEALVEGGHEVELYTNDIPDLESKLEMIFGKRVNVPIVQAFKPFKPFLVNRFLVYQRLMHFGREVKKAEGSMRRADVIFSTQDLLYLPMQKYAYTVQYVHFPEYLVHRERAVGVKSWFWKIYYAPAVRSFRKRLENVDEFLCNSKLTFNAIKERWGKRAEVIYPPVEISKFLAGSTGEKSQQVVTVGRFEPRKRYETVLMVASKLPEIPFFILGVVTNEKYYEHIRRLKPKNVHLLPNADFTTLKRVLSESMFYLHTMVGEHFGISIVEAMASGCIPIVPSYGGPSEFVIHGKNGIIYSNLLEAIVFIKALTTFPHSKLDQMRKEAIETAKKFDESIFKAKMIEVFKRVGRFVEN